MHLSDNEDNSHCEQILLEWVLTETQAPCNWNVVWSNKWVDILSERHWDVYTRRTIWLKLPNISCLTYCNTLMSWGGVFKSEYWRMPRRIMTSPSTTSVSADVAALNLNGIEDDTICSIAFFPFDLLALIFSYLPPQTVVKVCCLVVSRHVYAYSHIDVVPPVSIFLPLWDCC